MGESRRRTASPVLVAVTKQQKKSSGYFSNSSGSTSTSRRVRVGSCGLLTSILLISPAIKNSSKIKLFIHFFIIPAHLGRTFALCTRSIMADRHCVSVYNCGSAIKTGPEEARPPTSSAEEAGEKKGTQPYTLYPTIREPSSPIKVGLSKMNDGVSGWKENGPMA